jgi:DNA-binding NtrC family response regulator
MEPGSAPFSLQVTGLLTQMMLARWHYEYLCDREAHEADVARIVGRSLAMREVLRTLARMDLQDLPCRTILIKGETGTGKSCIARTIHYNGQRRDGPFVELNCPAVPGTLLQRELFGQGCNAAGLSRPGLIEVAHGGTLYLKEISGLPTAAQEQLCAFLTAGSANFKPDVLLLASSSHDLPFLAEQGKFVVELLYRLQMATITLPPLRERGADCVELAERFLHEFARFSGREPKLLSGEACRAIRTYSWPGNIRQLKNVMELAMLLVDEDVVGPEHLQLGIEHRVQQTDQAQETIYEIEAGLPDGNDMSKEELSYFFEDQCAEGGQR